MSTEITPTVTAVIATRNRAASLAQALRSVADQRDIPLETIVVDDGSDDETPQMLRAWAASGADRRVVRVDRSVGGAQARNRGVAVARGEFVAFLDDDDVWRPEKTARQVARLRAVPTAVAASCAFVVHAPGRRDRVVHPPTAPDMQTVLAVNRMGGASVCLARRQTLLDVGVFDPGLPSAQDWDLWIRLRGAGSIEVCPEPLVDYYAHEGARISRAAVAVHVGMRRVYFRYRAAMQESVRREVFGMVLYTRAARHRLPPGAAFRQWRRLSRTVQGRSRARYAWWLMAHLWRRGGTGA